MDSAEDKDARLGSLLDRFQRLREADPAASIEDLREEAGADFDEFVELARCLEAVQAGAREPPTDTGLERRSWPGKRALVVAGAVVIAAFAAWWASRPGPAVLRVQVHPDADVLVDGAPYRGEALAPGRRRVVIELDGFRRYIETVEIAGDEVRLTAHLVPIDPFDGEALRALAKSYGIDEGPVDPLLPRPLGSEPSRTLEQALQLEVPEALAMELRRFPPEVRGREDIRFLATRQLFRAGLFAESYAALRVLTDRYPDRVEPWLHTARALWGLGLVETTLYAEVRARWDRARKQLAEK